MQTVSTLLGPLSNVLLAVIFGVGYFVIARQNRQILTEMGEERVSRGRPQVVVQIDYSRLPMIDLLVRNISNGAAGNVSFEFSDPVESASGFVISDLPFFQEQLDFLEPDGEIRLAWGTLDSLAPLLKERGIHDGITVTVSYDSLGGTRYTNRWKVNPLLYEGYPEESYDRGVRDLAKSVEEISEEMVHRAEKDPKRGLKNPRERRVDNNPDP